MATTVTQVTDSAQPLGNKRMAIFNVTAGASDTDITLSANDSGMENILYSSYSPSASDDHGIVFDNFSDAGVTAAAGAVFIDSISNSDTGKIFVIGY